MNYPGNPELTPRSDAGTVRVQLLAVHTYRPTHHPRAHVLTLDLARPRGDRAEVTARTHTQRVRAANSLFGARGAPTTVSSRCICAPPPFSASSPRNLVEIPAGPTAMRIQNSRPNLRPRGPMLPTVTTVSVRPSNFEISSGEVQSSSHIVSDRAMEMGERKREPPTVRKGDVRDLPDGVREP